MKNLMMFCLIDAHRWVRTPPFIGELDRVQPSGKSENSGYMSEKLSPLKKKRGEIWIHFVLPFSLSKIISNSDSTKKRKDKK